MPTLPIPSLADLVHLLPLLAFGLALFFGSLVLLIAHRLTHPPRRTYGWAVAKNRPGTPGELDEPVAFEERTERHAGRSILLWEIEGLRAGGPVIVLTHGWGESRIHALDRLSTARAAASRVIAWDMPGHGDSPGRTSLGSREAAALCSLARSVRTDRTVVLWGWSLGAEVTLRAAAALQRTGTGVDAVVIESAFRKGTTPARAVMRGAGYPGGRTLDTALLLVGALGARPFDRFGDLVRTATAISGTPILAVHGAHDTVSPIADGRAIAEATGGEIAEFNAGHSDLWTGAHADAVGDRVGRFLAEST
ncbi:MAG: alpha/beta hydrolase [Planctomycetota bacterium]